MCDQTEVSYLPGEVVWVKLRALWWPGLVQDFDTLPEEITSSMRKRPLAIVKFFQEDYYEYVHKLDFIYHYNCSRKHEFIKKGMDLCRKKTADRPATMDFFPADVVTAEELTHGDTNILQDKAFKPDEKPKYTSLFGSEKKKFGKKKGKEESPLKDKVARRKKLTSKLQAMGWLSRGITANVVYPSPDIQRIVTHRRFLNKVRDPEAKSDYQSRIMEQKCDDEPCGASDSKYQCVICGYATRRLNVIVLHFNASHSSKAKNIFDTPSIFKRGSFPSLKLKGENRKSESGKGSLFSRKRTSSKGKSDKLNQKEIEVDSSDNDSSKVQPVKEKRKPGRKRKVQVQVEKDDIVQKEKKPKVLDSLLADWEEDAEQKDEDHEGDSRPRSDDDDGDEDGEGDESASADNETASAGKSSIGGDASTSKSKEVFEFDPDEDDSIDFDLTPNVKGFGRRIPRVISSSKDKKQGESESNKKSGKSKFSKKEDDTDEFESLLAETSMPSLPSVPLSATFSLDIEDEIEEPILKTKNEVKTAIVSEGKSGKYKKPNLDLAGDSKKSIKEQDNGPAKVTVEKIPDLAVQIPETTAGCVDETLDSVIDTHKNDEKPEKPLGSGDHTYVGSSGRKRRRSLLPFDKGDEMLHAMAIPVDVVEEGPRPSREPILPVIESSKVLPTPRRGRPPKRGRGGRGGSRTLKSQGPKSPSPRLSPKSPPHQSPKSPSSHSISLSPLPSPGPKSPQSQQGSNSPTCVRSPESPPLEQIPKSPSHSQSSSSPSAHQSPKRLQLQQTTKSPIRSPSMSPGPKSPVPKSPGPKSPEPKSPGLKSPGPKSPEPKSPGPKSPEPKSPSPKSPAPPQSPKSPQPYQSPSRQEPKSPQGLQGSKSPQIGSPVLLNPSSKVGGIIGMDSKLMKTPPQSPVKSAGDSKIAISLHGSKSPVKSPVATSSAVLLSTTSGKGVGSKVLTSGLIGLKKVSTPGAVVVQSKPDLQPEACGIAKSLSLSPLSVAASSGTVKTIKMAMSGTPSSSPVIVGKTGTPGSQPRKVMIVQGKGGQKMLLPAEASQQLLSTMGSGKKIMFITKGAGGAGAPGRLVLTPQQQKVLASGGKITTSTGQVVTSKGTLSSVSKLVPSKVSTPSASSSSASGIELSTEPPALVKTDGKKTYKFITTPQSKGNVLLNTPQGRQILLPVSSIAASGSGVTTPSGSKQFLVPVGAKNKVLLSGSGQKVILQMKSPKPGVAQSISPKLVQSVTPKTIQSITPKTSQPLKVTKIATMIQPVPQLTPIGAPKGGRLKQVKPVVSAKPVQSPPLTPTLTPKGTGSLKSPEDGVASNSGTQFISTPQKRSSGILPNSNLKTIVPQATASKKVSQAAKALPVETAPVPPMPGTVQVVAGAVPGLEQIQTIVPSVDANSGVALPALPTSTQQLVTQIAEDGSQVMYLIDNNSFIGSLDGTNQANLSNLLFTFDNMSQPASNVTTDFTFSAPSSGQDILAEALANTQVLQSEVPGGELGLDTSTLLSSHSSSAMYPPTLSHGVLETSLTLNQPIMTPLEDLSAVSSLQPPPASGVISVDPPSTITVPDITISTSSYASLPIPSATIQSTVFSDAQSVATYSTTTSADGSVFIEAPVVEGESFLTTDTVYEQTEGASMPLLDG